MNPAKFSQVVEQYQKLVYTICFQMVRDHHTAEDLAQETFLSAYSHIDRCPEESLRPWLARIATNKAKDWSGQIVLGEGGLPIPQLYQHDYKKVVCVYNGIKRSVSTSGCGATCLSMLIAYETGYTYQSPYTVFRDACQQGLYKGSGLSRSAMSQLAEQYALIGQWMDLNAQELLQTLEEGKPVIAHMGPGLFTQGGHYILLRGLTEEGGVLVNDPASPERSAMAYPVEVFIQESKSGAAFFVCEGADEEKVQALPTPDPELESQDDAHGLQEEAAQPQAQPTPAAA